jgi:hypothetical protein
MNCIPNIEECLDFARKIGASEILEVPILPREGCLPFRCHQNCEDSPVRGFYIVKDEHGFLHAYSHSVYKEKDGSLVDITPFPDQTQYNVFMYGVDLDKYNCEVITYDGNSVFINKIKIEETELMYYVYGLIDPRTRKPFYIGKGKGNRCLFHYSDKALSEYNCRKTSKIKKLNSLGYEPMVEFYAQNIEDEEIAYEIERRLILKYGRKGYEKNGILTNICLDSNPPNWSGKTYEEIYGEERAAEQKRKRTELQKKAGGYGPKQHKEETKKKISEAHNGIKNGNSSGLTEEQVIDIGVEFSNFFGGKIGKNKWLWYCSQNNIPPFIRKSFRFEGRDLFDILVETYDSEIVYDKQHWIKNDATGEVKRQSDWQYEMFGLPNGFRLGRK